ncbi:hypothetical protein [Bacteroides sp. NSJ-48]|jgi:hypothetical protein|uniref:hypothetical protein n=1 Tax=Bacteroides sp. NSJ-48 TaxID=2763020 RepID=UPI00164A423A|nr:hypothetical protein [Bacteroides sp. NSJ-48]MBC5610744.1 hypothetical protein [Bacteroides sp. NSJ-48]
MGAIKTMKEVESALPQKKEINYVRALDKDGNPILISKEDLAQVVGELLPIATPSKNGLVDKEMAPSSVENGVLKVNLISEYGTPTFLISIYSAASIGIFLLAAQTYNQKLGGKCVCIGENNLSIYVGTKNIYIEPHEHSNMNVCIIPLSDHSGVESVEKMEFEDLDAIKDKLTKIVPIALG